MSLQTVKSRKNFLKNSFLLASWKSLTKITGSGSISQRHGSANPDPDPDPHQNVIDPQRNTRSRILVPYTFRIIPYFRELSNNLFCFWKVLNSLSIKFEDPGSCPCLTPVQSGMKISGSGIIFPDPQHCMSHDIPVRGITTQILFYVCLLLYNRRTWDHREGAGTTIQQCCGSWMSIPDPNFFHPGSLIQGQKVF